MFTVRVIPIARGVFSDYLTFFSRTPIEIGSVVSISIRKRQSYGIVVEAKDVREEKMDIRSADFSLKKLGKTEPKRVFTAPFIAAAKEAALWHGIRESAVLSSLAPKTILTSITQLEAAPRTESLVGVKPDSLVLQTERGERVRTYRNVARESFARGESILIITPTIIEAETLTDELKRGIESSVIVLTSELPKKKLVASWNRIATDKTPLLIIGTGIALAAPSAKIGTIIIERESARSYRGIQRPHIDQRIMADALSRQTGARLIVADFPLRIDSRFNVEIGDADELSRSQVRPTSTIQPTITDTRKREEWKGERRLFSTLTVETKNEIERELARDGRVVVFAARRGIAPLTVCNDCGTPITDPTTGTPMVLHKTPDGNIFMSHRSGATLPSEVSCKTCRGWNLVTLGVGIERVKEELEKSFPKVSIYSLTKDTASTHAAAKKIAAQFYGSAKTILVGTERMLPYLTEPFGTGVIASLDSMLSLPAWRAHEYALSILYFLRERAENKFIVETRHPDHEIMKSLVAGNPLDFYREEIKERTKYRYPPISIFIGLSIIGTRAAVDAFSETVKEQFKDLDVVGPLPATQVSKNEWGARAVIRLARDEWPNEELAERLKALPPEIDIEIDPDEIV